MAKLSDLNDHLFDQLDRLSAAGLTPEQIEAECKRTDAIVAISEQVVDLADIQLRAAKLYAEHGKAVLHMLPAIGNAAQPSKDPGE